MITHNIGFYEKMAKITFQLSSNKHISSSGYHDIIFFLELSHHITGCIVMFHLISSLHWLNVTISQTIVTWQPLLIKLDILNTNSSELSA